MRRFVERRVEERVARGYAGATVDVEVGDRRFFTTLLSRGVVRSVSVRVFDAHVAAGAADLHVRRLVAEFTDVRVARRSLVLGRLRPVSLGSGRVEAVVDGPSLAAAVGLPLVFHRGEVEIARSVGPLRVSARGALTVDGRELRFRPGSLQGVPVLVPVDFAFALPASPLWPASASVRSGEGVLVFSCDLDELPAVLWGNAAHRSSTAASG